MKKVTLPENSWRKMIPYSGKYKTQYNYYLKVKDTEAYKKAQKERSRKSYLKNIEKKRQKYLKNREEILKKDKEDRIKNPEKYLEKNKRLYWKHRDKLLKRNAEYRLKNSEKIKAHKKIYAKKNKIKIRLYQRKKNLEKYHTDINYKMKSTIRRAIINALKGKDKSKKTLEFLGCSIEYFWKHLELKFTPGMTRENHGRFGWHVDHIIPCAAFDLRCPVQQLTCFHYSNLQPLWWRDNLKKGDKYEME